jgi:fibronectin type 3 domain-containing protein
MVRTVPAVCIICVLATALWAQPSLRVRSSPHGVYLFFGDTIRATNSPVRGCTGIVVYRSEAGSAEKKEVLRSARARKFSEFSEIVGDTIVKMVQRLTKTKTDDDLWAFVTTHQAMSDYGVMASDLRLLRAFGCAAIDPDVAPNRGKTYRYEARYLSSEGTDTLPAASATVTVGSSPKIAAPRIASKDEGDSAVSVTWSVVSPGDEAVGARVYRREGEEQPFELLPFGLMVGNSGDTVRYTFSDQVIPEQFYSYYIIPEDYVRNEGPSSDTVTVVSVGMRFVARVAGLSCLDTIGGLFLSWSPLHSKFYYLGVVIERSTDARTGFAAIDTVSFHDSTYTDIAVRTHTTYFYRLRTLTYNGTLLEPSSFANGSHANRYPPVAPATCLAKPEGRNIRLTWSAVPDPDLQGYRVLRCESYLDSGQIVSFVMVGDTVFLDTAGELHGRTSYIYYVKALNRNGLESPRSVAAVARPDRPVVPPAPGGVAGYADGRIIRLSWSDMRPVDETSTWYRVYRRALSGGSTANSSYPSPAHETAVKAGFTVVGTLPSKFPVFDDSSVAVGVRYEYGISVVDVFDVESSLSPTSSFALEQLPLLPPFQLDSRVLPEGIEVTWNGTTQSGASGFVVYRRSQAETAPNIIARLPLQETAFVDKNAAAGELYFYSVAVIAGEKESALSLERGISR